MAVYIRENRYNRLGVNKFYRCVYMKCIYNCYLMLYYQKCYDNVSVK